MKLFISGVTGSLGSALSKIALAENHTVVGYSRDELKQQKFPLHDRLILYLGDVRDEQRLVEATRGCELIFHLAALKHVDKLEECPDEALKTNVLGTHNVLHAQRMNATPRVILASTDKAAYPVNAYGNSKALAEKLVLRHDNNVVCRYGNVLCSRGSVVEALVKSLRTEQKVYLTDPNMTRFWITVEDAALFVWKNALGRKAGLKIPPMKAASLQTLAQATANVLNINSFQVVNTGARAGEKIHECLRTQYEGEEVHSNSAPQFTENELTVILKPIVKGLI